MHILLPYTTVVQHELGTRKTISWPDTVYNKQISSQCNLTVLKIEQVQDKYPLHT